MFNKKLGSLLVLREQLESFSRDVNEYMCYHCFYCKNCRACSLNTSLTNELKKNKFKSENKKVKWWTLKFIDEDKVELFKNSA